MRIQITLTVHDESTDEADDTGLTNEAYDGLMDDLSAYGYDIEVKREDA